MENLEKNDVLEARLPACSVELIPQSQELAVGCYELVDGETSERKGALEFYSVSEDDKLILVKDCSIDTNAILDMKVSCDSEILYYVDSNGFLNEFLTKQKEIKRKFQTTQGLCLSLCVKEKNIAVSSSVGSVSIVDAESFKETAWLPCHEDAEAWIVVLGPNNTMYTGGDDSTFCIWDLNSHETIVKKRFMCGQTSGEFHPTDDNYFVQGGYDDTLRIWDRRNWDKPLSELHIGGGVWRTRFNSDGDFILVPSMYNNAKVVKNDNGILKEVWSSDIHKSITYGACWMEKRKKFATCSFYDKKFALWSYE